MLKEFQLALDNLQAAANRLKESSEELALVKYTQDKNTKKLRTLGIKIKSLY